ncbi:MAG: ATP-binding protein [Bacteroidia bacterium]|nr:ATP-binding protein [Bacteroidia bacterium]
MKLTQLKLKNYRCYRDETIFVIDDLTCIIGKNDIGKSTIIEALDAFFNDKIDSGDLSVDSIGSDIEISCFFEEIPNQVILDTAVPTSPEAEGILNLAGQLEIRRVFTVGRSIRKSIFIHGNYPDDARIANLLSLKNAPLKAKAEELGVDLTNINRSKNPPIRQKIRDSIGGTRSLKLIKVDGNLNTDDNLKAIWSSINKMLPVFSLFKVDKTLDDKDADVQDPMKAAIDESLAIPEIQNLLQQIEDKVREKSTEIADRIIEKLKEFDESLAERLKSDFAKNPAWKKVFDLTLLNENNIPLNKRGSGIRRLVLLSFFQAQAEKRRLDKRSPSIIYAIEEPETSQHPNHQLIIIDALIRLSEQSNTQVLFTSHSANLVREIPIKSLRFVSSDDESNVSIEYGEDLNSGATNEETVQKIIDALGILPNPADRVKVLLYVEGNNDVQALIRYSKIMHAHDNTILNLADTELVGYVITGGSSLRHYIDNGYLRGLGKAEVHLYDNDKPEYRATIQQIEADPDQRKRGFNTTKIELENYLHHDAIIECYRDDGVNDLTLGEIQDEMDVPEFVAKALHENSGGNWDDLEPEKQKAKSDKKKKALNSRAVDKMTVERLRIRNGYDDLKTWFDMINSFCQ